MDADALLTLLGLLLQWRVALCLLLSSAAAFGLVQMWPWLSVWQGFVMAGLGLLPALWWEEAARARARPASAMARAGGPKTAASTAVLAAIVFGGVWGAASASSLHAAVAGVVVLLLAAWGWFRHAVTRRGWVSAGLGLLCVTVATVAYGAVALVMHAAS